MIYGAIVLLYNYKYYLQTVNQNIKIGSQHTIPLMKNKK